MIEIIQNILIFIFIFYTSFKLHETLHIKGQGFFNTGKIFVGKWWGETVGADKVKNVEWFKLSGGVLTSLVMFILCFCSIGFWQWSFLTLGFVQLAYGIYEGFYGVKYRYAIYISMTVVMLIIWMVK
jgi:hypothetical protein